MIPLNHDKSRCSLCHAYDCSVEWKTRQSGTLTNQEVIPDDLFLAFDQFSLLEMWSILYRMGGAGTAVWRSWNYEFDVRHWNVVSRYSPITRWFSLRIMMQRTSPVGW